MYKQSPYHCRIAEMGRTLAMPITMLFAARQAGAAYREYASDYRVLCIGQLVTAERFGFDHVSVISDPAREAADLGAKVRFFDHQPPALDEEDSLLADRNRLTRLRVIDPASGPRMSDRLCAVALLREKLTSTRGLSPDRMVEGWVEGPCAEAADLRGINRWMLDLIEEPEFVSDLLEFTSSLAIAFARAQLAAGAQVIGVGDAASSLVGPTLYRQFLFEPTKRLVDAIHEAGGSVRLHICGNIRKLLPIVAQLNVDLIDIDSMVPLDDAVNHMPAATLIAGNLDPVAELANAAPEEVQARLQACHATAGVRWVASAGCEIPLETPSANVKLFHMASSC